MVKISTEHVIISSISKTRCINDCDWIEVALPFSFFSAGMFGFGWWFMSNIETFTLIILQVLDGKKINKFSRVLWICCLKIFEFSCQKYIKKPRLSISNYLNFRAKNSFLLDLNNWIFALKNNSTSRLTKQTDKKRLLARAPYKKITGLSQKC